MVFQESISLAPGGGGTYEITELVAKLVGESGIGTGTCQLFVHSSSTAIFITDVADEHTRNETAAFLADLAPDSGDAGIRIDRAMATFDDAARHVVMQHSLSIPVSNQRPAIGVWQGIFLWNRSASTDERKLTVTVIGE